MADTMSPEDKLAVMDLIADYAFKLDSGDLDGYVDNFTPDAVMVNSRGNLVGREAIREYVAHLIEVREAGPGSLHHIMGVPSIHGDSERCYAECYVMIPGDKPNEGADGKRVFFALVGMYQLDIVKHEGRWRFAKRVTRMDLVGPERR
jgi:uncharacterized protein (TIGR02246 family)